jgi:murein DD-endopeptidase MepM/ murein hydrolase activator NlpD
MLLRRVRFRVLPCLLILALIAGSGASAQPRTQDDIARRLEQIARQRAELDRLASQLRGDITQDAARREALTEELEELQAIVDEVQARVNSASNTLAGIQERVDRKNAAIKKTQRVLESRLDALHDRAVHIYKRGPASLVDIMLEVRGVGDFIRRFSYLTHATHQDNVRIAEIRRAKASIIRDRDEIAKLRDKAAAQVAVVAAERNRKASVANEVAGRRAAVAGELESSYGRLGDIAAQKAKFEREVADLRSESAAIAAFLRGRGNGPAQVSPKGMTWPAQGPVTSTYGWRVHPIFGTRRFHAGIDIGAPTGSQIVAAGSGTVVFVGAKGGYGNATIIDHGGGIATLYGHQSSIGVGNGQHVSIGQRIGGVGCTGYCTGPHLHFEVRVNGDPTNPMGWLP